MLPSRFRFLALFLMPASLCAATPRPPVRHLSLPLVFEPNRGQADPEVRFLSRNTHYSVELRAAEVELRGAGRAAPLRLCLEGGNLRARPEGFDPLPGRSFYYHGNDPSRWQTDIPQYTRVRYHDFYPGIDVVFYGSANELEYDLIVAPHADPRRVRLSFNGARKLAVESNGDLRIESSSGVLWQRKPAIYQEDRGARRPIAGRYVVRGRQVQIELEGYDSGRRLVIDPVLTYATYFGGSLNEAGAGLAVDAAGNAYFAGVTSSTDFPTTPKPAGGATHGSVDVFAVKLDPSGQHVLYSVTLGGGGANIAYGIAVDPAGNAWITGATTSTNFPTLNAYQAYNKGGVDAFVLKLDPSGNLIYSTYLGGARLQPAGWSPSGWGPPKPVSVGRGIAADASGNVYVTGETFAADFPFTLGALNHTPNNGEAFVAEFGTTGRLVFSTLIGGSGWDAGVAIAPGSSGTVWVAGVSYSSDLPVTPGVIQSRYGGDGGHSGTKLGDAWVAKLNPAATSQNIIAALTYLGGSLDDVVTAIQPDSSDNLYLTGFTVSTDFPVTANALQKTFGGGAQLGDVWIAKVNSALTTLLFSTYLGGAGDDGYTTLALDRAGDIYVAGLTTTPNLTPASLGANPNAIRTGYVGSGGDYFLLELNPSATSALYFTYVASVGSIPNLSLPEEPTTGGCGLALDGAGNIYFLGTSAANDVPVRQALQTTPAGGVDLFLLSGSPAVLGGSTAQNPAITATMNYYSLVTGPIAPGELATLIGTNFGDSTPVACGGVTAALPTSCAGVSLLINGNAAPLLSVSSGAIGFQAPADLTGTSASFQVVRQTGGQTFQSTVAYVTVAPVAPGLESADGSGKGLGVFVDLSMAQISASNPAHPGDVVTVLGTGFGATNPVVASGSLAPSSPPALLTARITVSVGGQSANVVFQGRASNMVGVDAISFVLPQGLSSGNLPVVATIGGQSTPSVLLPVAGPKVTIGGVSNNASGAAAIESGSWVSIYGANLSATTRGWQASDFSGNNLPTALDGVRVKINGKSAAVCYISPGQLNVQAPTDTALGPVPVEVTNSYGTATATVNLQAYAPGFFTFNGKYVAAVHVDGAYVAPAGYFGTGVASRPAQPGEILLLFGTGFGPTTPAVPAGQIVNSPAPLADLTQLHIRIGGVVASVQYGGLVLAGEYQFNVVVPPVADGDQPIIADIAGASTQSGVVIPVKN